MLTQILTVALVVLIAAVTGLLFCLAAFSLIDEQSPAKTLREEWEALPQSLRDGASALLARVSSLWQRLRGRCSRKPRATAKHRRTVASVTA